MLIIQGGSNMTGTAAAQCGLFTHNSVPVIFEPPCIFHPKSFDKSKRLRGCRFYERGNEVCQYVF
jgi:hypothetical protein